MSAPFTWILQMELNGTWVDVTGDVMGDSPKTLSRGIDGTAVTDRVAKVGTFSFVLDNSTSNSGGLMGYYSLDNANCRSGFKIGTKVRWAITIDFSSLLDEDGAELLDEDGNALTVDAGICKFFGKDCRCNPGARRF